jgi:hypothetical protein
MKAIKSLILFGISLIVVSCFEPPTFSSKPQIEFEDIYFGKSSTKTDSVVLTISFKDGDGDLGLDDNYTDEPYHDQNFFLANGGTLTPVGKSLVYSDLPPFLNIPAGANGKLATVRTRKDPAYSNLPGYNDRYSCTFYRIDSVFISEEDRSVFDATYNIKRVLNSNTQPDVYILYDTFYVQKNPNYSNIEVQFFVKENNEYKEFDWYKEFCTIDFDQRFPVLSDKDNTLEGNLIYSMKSDGFESLFSVKTLNLKITIRDRALNISNTIETGDFTLEGIRRR